MSKWIMRALVVAPLVATGFVAAPSAEHWWGGYHWARESNTFTLKVGDKVSSGWDPYLIEALSDWSQSSVLDLQKTGGKGNGCQPQAGMILACAARYGSNGWLGIAQVWVTEGVHITQSIIRMNDTYFVTSLYNKPEWKRMVMCQEIAHAFGLDHQDEIFDNTNLGSCMDYTSNPLGPPSNEHPGGLVDNDYAQIEMIYGSHLDNTTTVAKSSLPKSMPPAMGQISFDTPAQWGRLVRTNANGRAQVYELDFSRGYKVITHVFWADPIADAQ